MNHLFYKMEKFFENVKNPLSQNDIDRLKSCVKNTTPIATFELPKFS